MRTRSPRPTLRGALFRGALFRSALLVLATSAAACGDNVGDARPQWLITVSTDAPVPQLGDRLLVEIVAADGSEACSGCRRLFGMDGNSAWPLSFGIPDDGGPPPRVRVRLFRSDHTDPGGAPAGGVPLDRLGSLPPSVGNVQPIAVNLYAACAGIASDLAAGTTCDPATGALVALTLDDGRGAAPPAAGSFAAASSIPCSRPASDGMVCVEGGLFVRGSTTLALAFLASLPAAPERLVRLSPFAMDRTETTVRQMRAFMPQASAASLHERDAAFPACTFTTAAGAYDDFPVNCVSRALAAGFCASTGKRLPTEAEWEFAAGGRDAKNHYSWGNDPDACPYAIVGVGRVAPEGAEDSSILCRAVPDAAPRAWGPRAVTESNDVTALGIRDLGGNVSEWVADFAEAYDGPCSAGPNVLVDPRCDGGTATNSVFVARGGAWSLAPFLAQVSYRGTYAVGGVSSAVGFRCVMSL